MKLLIIDDEYLVRTGIRETIDWKSHNIDIVGEAADGTEGFKLAMELKPDIIITDIKMPAMDGVELAQKLYSVNYDGAVIVLSGYNEFEYARKALETGVYYYILKPADNSEIVEKVLSAARRLEEKRREKMAVYSLSSDIPFLRNKAISDLLSGEIRFDDEARQKFKALEIEIPYKGSIIHIISEGGEESLNAFEEIFREKTGCKTLSAFSGGTVTLICESGKQQSKDLAIKAVKDFEKRYQDILSIGIAAFETPHGINEAYKEAIAAAKNKLFVSLNSVNTIEDGTHNYSRNVLDIIKYIAENYNKNLTVKSAAEALYVSESYLMHLFKKEVGKTFNEYLTEYRMAVAKKLLREGRYRVCEIAEMVGYSDVKYFGQVFKKVVGLIPRDYIKNGERL